MIQIVVENKFSVSKAVMQILEEPMEESSSSLQSSLADKEKMYLPLKEKLKSTLHPKEVMGCYF